MIEPKYRIGQIVIMRNGGKPTQFQITGGECDDNGWTYYAKTVSGTVSADEIFFIRDYEVEMFWSDKTNSWVVGSQ